MKEYTITMKFSVEAKDADYEKISEFAQKMSDIIVDELNDDGIDIVEASIEEIEDNNDYDDYDDAEYFDEDED